MSRTAKSFWSCLFAVGLAAAAAQQPVRLQPSGGNPARSELQARIDRAIAELGQLDRAADACAFLERLGAPALPSLRLLLAQTGPAPSEQTLLNALYVLGRLRERALPALPEGRAGYEPFVNVVDPATTAGLKRQ